MTCILIAHKKKYAILMAVLHTISKALFSLRLLYIIFGY